jgi:excisionase family DNA binding protein
MTSIMERRVPRYGSAAELASYGGVSVKTVRRLIDGGQVRGLKVGRRVIIPFEDFDAHVSKNLDEPRKARPARASFDARGQAIPLPAEEEAHRQAGALLALDKLDDLGDDGEQAATFALLAELS